MDWLEEELKHALARQEPSPGFEVRVKPKVVAMPPRRWMAAAAAILCAVVAGEGYRWHQGEVAKEQVLLAMRIAGGKLNRVQMEIARTRP